MAYMWGLKRCMWVKGDVGGIGVEWRAEAGDGTEMGGAAVESGRDVWLAGGGLDLSLVSPVDLSFSPLKSICDASSSASFVVSFDASVTGNSVPVTSPHCGHFHSKDFFARTFRSSGV